MTSSYFHRRLVVGVEDAALGTLLLQRLPTRCRDAVELPELPASISPNTTSKLPQLLSLYHNQEKSNTPYKAVTRGHPSDFFTDCLRTLWNAAYS